MANLISLDAAHAMMTQVIQPISAQRVCALSDALHCTTAVPIIAPYSLPPFTNTGVDGYAFQHTGISEFKLVGASFAGAPFTGTLGIGEATRIATGAVLPLGADTVVMQEYCAIANDVLTVQNLPPRGGNIRQAGADIAAGAIALPAGHKLRAQDIALLGGLGFTAVPVLRKLRIAIASTGHELLPAGTPLAPGQIIDTNSLMLRQLLANADGKITMLPALPDDYIATHNALQHAAMDHDLIITTGGVSVGDRDFVRDVLHENGTVHFWKIAIRPGKPVLFGQLGDCLMLGLPGNPVSALVTFCLLVQPLLAVLCGNTPVLPPAFHVPLAVDLNKDVLLRSFPRAKLVLQNGEWQALPYHDQSSNLFTSLTQSDGLLDLPSETGNHAAGELVQFRPFN